MLKAIIKSQLQSNKPMPKPKFKIEYITSPLPPNLETFKQKLLSGSGFIVNN